MTQIEKRVYNTPSLSRPSRWPKSILDHTTGKIRVVSFRRADQLIHYETTRLRNIRFNRTPRRIAYKKAWWKRKKSSETR